MDQPIDTLKALDGIRVLDLGGQIADYCTKLLGDLGADVIKVERPGGDFTRRIGPFFHDEPDLEKSLYFFYFNTSKKSITLNLDKAQGQEILRELTKTTDIIVEAFPAGNLDKIGLGYKNLKGINNRLIVTSITGFGQEGPYKDFKASELIGLAMSGTLYQLGFPEDPPVSIGSPWAHYMTATYAAIGSLMALFNRDITNEGQQVDISEQAAVVRLADFAVSEYGATKVIRKRTGQELYRGVRDVFHCKDGDVVCSALGGSGAKQMLQWMDSEGMASDLLDEKYEDAIALIGGIRQLTGMKTGTKAEKTIGADRLSDFTGQIKHIEEVWEAFLMTHTKAELFEGAQRRGVGLMPCNNAKDIVHDAHLNARNYFVNIEHPEFKATLKYPGAPYRLSETPWNASRAPHVGEHNIDIYKNELGFSHEQLCYLLTENII